MSHVEHVEKLVSEKVIKYDIEAAKAIAKWRWRDSGVGEVALPGFKFRLDHPSLTENPNQPMTVRSIIAGGS